jgi:nucleolar pre-ribosomal-associated protein 1
MPKRSRDQEESQPLSKKSKPNGHPAPEEIHFARQLQDLLAFRQDGVQQLKHGIASFKTLLESILYRKNEDDRARQLSILREYLDTQKPNDIKDTERPFLAQLWQAWSFASQNNDERLTSSIASIFTLLLKTLSSLIDFREHGFILCRTVLQHQHLRLIKRCLDAPKQKDFLISPCLRLLIEVVSFDGGVLAREVYKRREQTFDFATLRRNLGLTRTDFTDEEEARRRPAIRTLTIRYILGHLKYLHEGGKVDVLKSRPLCTSLFHFLRDDPAEVVIELLSVTEQHILKDSDLPRSAKSALLAQQNLERATEIATRSHEGHAAAERAFSWLRAVCTNTSYGVLRASGWYPAGTTKSEQNQAIENAVDLGLDSIDFYDRDDRPNIRNTTLLGWIQTLRPHSNLRERELVLTCFSSAPELVAAYFTEKNMQLEPKLSNTWIGYASFLFEVVQLPLPEYLGNENEFAPLPPQTNIVIENILPQPLTQKVLTRCLNQNSDLITFFAVRLLILAFEKTLKIRSLMSQHADSSHGYGQLWQEASDRLLLRFIDNCPAIKDIVAAFRRLSDDEDHALQREAAARLLQRYYNVAPLHAMEEQFDVSASLTTALVRKESDEGSAVIRELRQLELEQLLQIAQQSPGMRWFTKQGDLVYSPILTLLNVHSKDFENRFVRGLVYKVLSRNSIVSTESGCEALLGALAGHDDFSKIGPFLDDCFTRAARQPVKYLDTLDSIVTEDLPDHSKQFDTPPSTLALVFLEQASFVLSREEDHKREQRNLINAYMSLLMHTEEHSAALDAIWNRLAAFEGFATEKIESESMNKLKEVQLQAPLPAVSEIPLETETIEAAITFPSPPHESGNHPELFKWSQKDLDMAIEDGEIAALILCLCSQYPDIRTQALAQLYKLEENLLNSAAEDRAPVYILIGELIETYEQNCLPDSEALPYMTGCFATHALNVQTNPGHFLYPKINKFLNRGPSWRINKLPNYWIENTILYQPEEDDAYWKEAQWVLDWLVDGLRMPADLEILRKTGVFERVMSFCSSPGVVGHQQVKHKVLEMVWRATFVDGGSTTIVTRTGVLAWLSMMTEGSTSVEAELKKRVLETCDRVKIEEWSGFELAKL